MTACTCPICQPPPGFPADYIGTQQPAPDPMPSILDPLRNLLRRVARWGR